MGDFTFVEQESYEANFAQVYDREIAPYLRKMEERRIRAIKRSQKIIAAIGAASLFLAWRAYLLDPVLPIMPIAFGGFASLFFYISRGDKLQGELTAFIRPILSDFLEDISFSEESSAEEVQLEKLERLCLAPKADSRAFGPRISGKWRGVSYQLVKASFFERYRDQDDKQRTRTLFNGILVEIECWNSMPTIVFLPDFGKIGNQLYSWATRDVRPPHKLDLPDELERSFEVYTDDRDRAMEALDTSFGQKILKMSEKFQGSGSHMSTAFQGNAFFMAIRLNHDFLSFDVMNRPLSEVDEKIHQAFRDLTIPRRIINQLLD
jgi:hypothetical protein